MNRGATRSISGSHQVARRSKIWLMRARIAFVLGLSLLVPACIGDSGTPSGGEAGASTPTSALSPLPTSQSTPEAPAAKARNTIRLPTLPSIGLAANWARGHRKVGVSLLTTDGRVIAVVHHMGIWGQGPSGVIILRNGRGFWLLKVPSHRLVRIKRGEAISLTSAPKAHLAVPPGSQGSWAWTLPVLGQYYQNGYGSQLSECAKPIAMFGPAPGAALNPVTGDSLGAAQPSWVLGWTKQNEPVIAVADGPCDSPPGGLPAGVYIFDGEGHRTRVPVPEASYVFQMWTT